MKQRLQKIWDAYGSVAIGTYFTIFAAVFAGFALAIKFGLKVESASATAGTLAAAYVATKLTQPLRILATLALTPLVARLLRRSPK